MLGVLAVARGIIMFIQSGWPFTWCRRLNVIGCYGRGLKFTPPLALVINFTTRTCLRRTHMYMFLYMQHAIQRWCHMLSPCRIGRHQSWLTNTVWCAEWVFYTVCGRGITHNAFHQHMRPQMEKQVHIVHMQWNCQSWQICQSQLGWSRKQENLRKNFQNEVGLISFKKLSLQVLLKLYSAFLLVGKRKWYVM